MAAPDQGLSEAAGLGRSSSMDAREALPRSDSQRKSNSKVGRKGARSGNDLFVCFAPRTSLNLVSASRPVLSPARDKGKETGGRRSGRTLSSSIFSKGAAKKQGFEAGEEPTSPKVTCIGQVRAKSKHNKKDKTIQDSKSGLRKGSQQQRSLRASAQEESKKESACSSFGKDFSCFGLPCDSYGSLPSFRGDKKSCGTVFAKSLVLIQQEGEDKVLAMGAPRNPIGGHFCSEVDIRVGERATPPASELESQAKISSAAAAGEATSCIRLEELETVIKAKERVEDPISEDQTDVEEDDTFEAEPPPPNALLLMRSKVEHLRVVVPPPSVNITLKRSTSAPAQCRTSEDGDDQPVKEADYYEQTEQMLEVRGETHNIMSAEDLPKPASAQKSFLQRCKSVSQSLTRSSSVQGAASAQSSATVREPIEGDKSTSQEARLLQDAEEASTDEEKSELYLVNDAVSRRRSDSEALKVSLDVVPETWLWEDWMIARQQAKETSASGRRLDMKQVQGASAAEWVDAELEASLWKSCQVDEPSSRRMEIGRSLTKQAAPPLPNVGASTPDSCLDAEVEATLWRSCRMVASHVARQALQHTPKNGDLAEIAEARKVPNIVQEKEDSTENAANLGRSSSVGSQRGNHLLERDYFLRRSFSVGTRQQQETRGYIEKKINSQDEEKTENPHETFQACDSLHVGEVEKATSNNEESSTHGSSSCVVEDKPVGTSTCRPENSLSGEETERETIMMKQQTYLLQQEERSFSPDDETAEELQRIYGEEAMAPSPSSVLDRPAPPPSPAPAAVPPETVLFLRCDLGAFRISLDACANNVDDHDQQQQQYQKVMRLEAMSRLHIHEVQGTYARLLKATSGKERTSLSSTALRLQRCKSEPVRLASY